jgi:site-specific DNA-methyltransferase (adenine-specific)
MAHRTVLRNAGIAGSGTPHRNVHFSCATVEWETPQWLFEELAWIYGGFTLDPCATRENAKCERFFTRSEDGLAQPWDGKVFCNPPYDRNIGKWVRKAFEESLDGCARGLLASGPHGYALVAGLRKARPCFGFCAGG